MIVGSCMTCVRDIMQLYTRSMYQCTVWLPVNYRRKDFSESVLSMDLLDKHVINLPS